MPDEPKASEPTAASPMQAKPVKFIHRQNELLPTFAADGAWGALNHYNMIRLAFYTENPMNPTAVIQPVSPDGVPQGDQFAEGSADDNYFLLERHFQCNVVLQLSSAIQIYQMLGNFIKMGQQQLREQMMDARNQMQESEAKKQP